MFETDAGAAVGQTLGEKYIVRRLLGSGGMGAVYEVEHRFTRRVGALKLLHQTYAGMPQVVERFIREASAAGRIGNPHIVETIDAGKFDTGEPYMFMELLAGSPVNELIMRRGRLQLDEAIEIVAQAAEGLEAAHQTGIVHRDIKPENLFLCSGDKPFIKILDFGISKFATGDADNYRLTADGAALGTPYYMSPEQVLGSADVDVRTDIYSLGVVLYECLTGRVPFEADALPALSVKIHSGDYPPLKTLLKDVPADIESVVTTAMSRSPAARYPSAEVFRKALLECRPTPAFSLAPTVFESAPAPPHVTGTPAITARPPVGSTTAGVASNTAGASLPASTRASEKALTGARTRWLVLGAVAAVVGVGVVALKAPSTRSDTVPSADHLPESAVPAVEPVANAPLDEEPVASPTPSALPDPMSPPSATSARPPTPHRDAVSKQSDKAPAPQPAKAKATDAKPSRAAQDGLSEENPFSK